MAGVAALAAASQLAIPLEPVPITMQTLAVTLAGALLGPRVGALTVIVWLALAAAGLPLLADGSGGLAHMTGATAGYLAAFPVAAFCTGWLAEKGWDGRRPRLAFLNMLAGNAVCLAIGGGWLAGQIGAAAALSGGVLPFLPGAAAKAALGALILWLLVQARARTTLA